MTRPDDSWVLIQLAKALKMEKELDQALTCCRRAILLNPDQSAYYRLLAELLSEKGDIHEATLMLERAIKLEPDSSELLKAAGICWLSRAASMKPASHINEPSNWAIRTTN